MKSFTRKGGAATYAILSMPFIQTHIDEELHKELKHLSVSLSKSQGDLLKEAVAMLLTAYAPTKGEVTCQKKP